MIKIWMGLPSTGWSSTAQTHALRKMEKKYADRVELVYPDKCVYRQFHDYARNMIVEEFLASDCDILWFLDSDVQPPEDVLDIVTEHGDKWQAAGAPYPVFMATGEGKKMRDVVFTVYRSEPGAPAMTPTDIPMEGLDFVDGVATGCMFLKRGLFMRLQKPYFEFVYDKETRGMQVGEDLGFCLKLKELGIRFFVDYAKTCGHMKEIDLMEVNNFAMNYAKRSIERYATQVSEELKAHAAASKKKQAPGIWLPK